VGLGIEVVEIPEFRAGLDEARLGEHFTAGELEYARTQARHWENLGARFAAKRAVMRALGEEPDRANLRDVEVVRGVSGELSVRFHGETLERTTRLDVHGCSLSMTHTRKTALAVAILES
jgi:holo-[acyl-carrier protein] synthase